MIKVRYGTFALLLAAILAWGQGGCKKKIRPSARSKAVRCADLADDFAGALQDSGMVAGSRSEEAIRKFDKDLREACLDDKVPERVFQCLTKVKPRVFSRMVTCLPEDLRSLVPALAETDESGDRDDQGEPGGASDDEP